MGFIKGIFGNKKEIEIIGVAKEFKEDRPSNSIVGFAGEYKYLSNTYSEPVAKNGIIYTSNDGVMLAQRMIEMCARANVEGKRPDMPDLEETMENNLVELTKLKFTQNKVLAKKLISTGDKYLNDTTVDNKLGKILMNVREELKNEISA